MSTNAKSYVILHTDWIYSKSITAQAALLTFPGQEEVLLSTSLMS